MNSNVVVIWIEDTKILASSKLLNQSWETPVSLSNSNASSPRIVVDQAGNATAIWIENDALISSSKPFQGTWTLNQILDDSLASLPELSVDSTGNVMVIWVHEDFAVSATKLINQPWTNIAETISGVGAQYPQIAIGADGSVAAVWHQIDESFNTIYTANKTLQTTWQTPQAISNPQIHAVYPKVAVDEEGNVVAGWYQYTLENLCPRNVSYLASFQAVDQAWSIPLSLSQNGIVDPYELTSEISFDAYGNAVAAWTTSFDGIIYEIQSTTKIKNQIWETNIASVNNLFSFDFDFAIAAPNFAVGASMILGDSINITTIQSTIGGVASNYWSNPQIVCLNELNNGQPRIASVADSNVQNTVVVWQNFNGFNTVIQAACGTNNILQPPSQVAAIQSQTNHGIFIEYYNTVTWEASPTAETTRYFIFRDGLYIDQVDSSTLEFSDRNRVQNVPTTYGIAAYSEDGSQSITAYADL